MSFGTRHKKQIHYITMMMILGVVRFMESDVFLFHFYNNKTILYVFRIERNIWTSINLIYTNILWARSSTSSSSWNMAYQMLPFNHKTDSSFLWIFAILRRFKMAEMLKWLIICSLMSLNSKKKKQIYVCSVLPFKSLEFFESWIVRVPELKEKLTLNDELVFHWNL